MRYSKQKIFCPNCGKKLITTSCYVGNTILMTAYQCSSECAKELELKSARSILGKDDYVEEDDERTVETNSN